MAQEIFNSLADGRHRATSAGTEVHEHQGEKLFARESGAHVLAVLKEIGLEANQNIRTQLTPELMSQADIVVTMAESEASPNYLLENHRRIIWEVPDPFSKSEGETRTVRNSIEMKIRKLLVDLS